MPHKTLTCRTSNPLTETVPRAQGQLHATREESRDLFAQQPETGSTAVIIVESACPRQGEYMPIDPTWYRYTVFIYSFPLLYMICNKDGVSANAQVVVRALQGYPWECPASTRGWKDIPKNVCPRQSRNYWLQGIYREDGSSAHPQNVGFYSLRRRSNVHNKSNLPSTLRYKAADDEAIICLARTTSPPKAYHTAIKAHRHHLVPCFIALAFPREPHPSHPAFVVS